MHSHRYKTWDEAAGLPETSAPLRNLPAELSFPADFPEPIRYDAPSGRLVYRGFMCSVSYSFLRGLSTDSRYLIAVDALFQASAAALARPKKNKRLARAWMWLSGAASVGAVAVVLAWMLAQ
jgi:hypothetical protein